MDTAFTERNRAQRERLKQLAARATEVDLGRPLEGGEWTVSVALAHLAYWDGRTLATLEASLRHGLPRAWWDTPEADAVNAVRLRVWLATPPGDALRDAIHAAEAVDHLLESLAPGVVQALAGERPFALDRSRHRGSHLDEVERALAS